MCTSAKMLDKFFQVFRRIYCNSIDDACLRCIFTRNIDVRNTCVTRCNYSRKYSSYRAEFSSERQLSKKKTFFVKSVFGNKSRSLQKRNAYRHIITRTFFFSVCGSHINYYFAVGKIISVAAYRTSYSVFGFFNGCIRKADDLKQGHSFHRTAFYCYNCTVDAGYSGRE